MINKLKECEEWYLSHDDVIKADCQLVYYPDGMDSRGERTFMINMITFNDGTQWREVPERIGGDYRGDPRLFIEGSKVVFKRHLEDTTR